MGLAINLDLHDKKTKNKSICLNWCQKCTIFIPKIASATPLLIRKDFKTAQLHRFYSDLEFSGVKMKDFLRRIIKRSYLYLLELCISYFGPQFFTEAYITYIGIMGLKQPLAPVFLGICFRIPSSQNYVFQPLPLNTNNLINIYIYIYIYIDIWNLQLIN